MKKRPSFAIFAIPFLLTSCQTTKFNTPERSIASDSSGNTNPIIIGHARFTVLGADVIRMEYSPNGEFVDVPSTFAIERTPKLTKKEKENLQVELSSGALKIKTGH